MQTGTLAEWVSSPATAGSLFLGFTILLRDRRQADRAEATQVVAWFVNLPDGNVEVTIINGADRPVVHVTFCLASLDEQGKRAPLVRMINVAPVLPSGETVAFKIPFRDFHANMIYPSYVQFRDSNGANWRRNIRSGKLRRTKIGLDRRKRLMLLKSPRKAITYLRAQHYH